METPKMYGSVEFDSMCDFLAFLADGRHFQALSGSLAWAVESCEDVATWDQLMPFLTLNEPNGSIEYFKQDGADVVKAKDIKVDPVFIFHPGPHVHFMRSPVIRCPQHDNDTPGLFAEELARYLHELAFNSHQDAERRARLGEIWKRVSATVKIDNVSLLACFESEIPTEPGEVRDAFIASKAAETQAKLTAWTLVFKALLTHTQDPAAHLNAIKEMITEIVEGDFDPEATEAGCSYLQFFDKIEDVDLTKEFSMNHVHEKEDPQYAGPQEIAIPESPNYNSVIEVAPRDVEQLPSSIGEAMQNRFVSELTEHHAAVVAQWFSEEDIQQEMAFEEIIALFYLSAHTRIDARYVVQGLQLAASQIQRLSGIGRDGGVHWLVSKLLDLNGSPELIIGCVDEKGFRLATLHYGYMELPNPDQENMKYWGLLRDSIMKIDYDKRIDRRDQPTAKHVLEDIYGAKAK